MTQKLLSYQSHMPARRGAWAPVVVLWLWVVVNALGALAAFLVAIMCLDFAAYAGLFAAMLGLVFLCTAIMAGAWSLRVAQYALSVFRRQPQALSQALAATRRSFLVLSICVALATCPVIFCACIWQEDLWILVAIVLVPYTVIAALVGCTKLLLRRHAALEAMDNASSEIARGPASDF